jgi:hypothetical protein
MDEMRMMKIVERYSRQSELADGEIKITRLPDWKSVYVEYTDEIGRAIMMTEYKVDGKNYRAGYSSRSQTVYVSHA